jgi:hypothetical protein
VIVPTSNTTVIQNNPVIVDSVNGSGSSLGNFTYNPSQTSPTQQTTLSGLPPNVNTQPQQTGPVVMSSQTTSYGNGFMQSITIQITPEALTKGWSIALTIPIQINYEVREKISGPNNTNVVITKYQGKITTNTSLYVNMPQQKIVITSAQLESLLMNDKVSFTSQDITYYNIGLTSENIILNGVYQSAVQWFNCQTKFQ